VRSRPLQNQESRVAAAGVLVLPLAQPSCNVISCAIYDAVRESIKFTVMLEAPSLRSEELSG
jgi:hypothetical protein